MIVTSEYVYDNIKLNETCNIVQKPIEEYEKEYGFDLYRDVKVRCVGEFYDKIINETKIIIFDRYNFIGELNKFVQKSRGEIKLVKIIEIKIIIESRIYKNITDVYFKSWCKPIIWKKFYGRYINVNQNEKHYYHFNKK